LRDPNAVSSPDLPKNIGITVDIGLPPPNPPFPVGDALLEDELLEEPDIVDIAILLYYTNKIKIILYLFIFKIIFFKKN
jgi:hypothetical protein